MGLRPTEGDETLTSSSAHMGTGAPARPAERSSVTSRVSTERAQRVKGAREESAVFEFFSKLFSPNLNTDATQCVLSKLSLAERQQLLGAVQALEEA